MRLLLAFLGLVVYGPIAAQPAAQPPAWTHFVDSARTAWEGPESKLLTPEEQASFAGVAYFPYDSAFAVPARYVPVKQADTLYVPTSRQRTSRYLPIADVHFTLADSAATLTVYRGLDPWSEMDTHFLMFTDVSNVEGTYGGGRYLDLRDVDETQDTVTVDFNFAYNPYCAYADKFSCPIPPAHNDVPVAIRAGARVEESH